MIECMIRRHMGAESKEHIIPEAIGGRLITRKVCVKCNNDHCAKLDAALADDRIMILARNHFKIPGYEDVADKVFGRGELQDGTKVVVNFDEANQVYAPRVLGGKNSRDNGDGTKIITWSLPEGTQPNDALSSVRKELARHGETELSEEEVRALLTFKEVEIEKPVVDVRYKLDIYALAPAGLKIGYEFTVETLGHDYLADSFADEARDLIVAGIPKGEAARAAFSYQGGGIVITPSGIPNSEHKLILVRQGERLFVLMSLFGTFVGQYTMSNSASRYQPFTARMYTLDVLTRAANEYSVPSR
jgi:hypothetical protein